MRIRNPNVQTILESHVKEWFIKERERQQRKNIPPILLSRQWGAAGLTVAEELASRLGWPYYDKHIIKEIAQASGREASVVAVLDERDRNTFREFANIFSQSPEVSQDEYVQHLKRFIRALVIEGGNIIVGRGANFVVSSEEALRARLIADAETCQRIVQQRYGLTEAEAAEEVPRREREQERFIRRYFGENVADPHHYDIVINITHVGTGGAVNLILTAYRQKFPGIL